MHIITRVIFDGEFSFGPSTNYRRFGFDVSFECGSESVVRIADGNSKVHFFEHLVSSREHVTSSS
ncbi:hypothetical protein P879_00229 [Paragonimus westermani]|uniref:Uncharacterized protein n=1 Tax=Paragonimus westermani TaxID=34504 RepID=A0A8T0DYR3_9TREM|nr:hypothetical protein P879_00229 [Paragonimus westermani]